MAGTLFVVATPIGNLEDLSFRALRVLKEADLIAAEDTRRTAKLLAHYGIHTPMVSLREHNERRETPRLLERLANGASIALVSDAGTPGIADPGQYLVGQARQAGIGVSPIPGPSAVMAAMSVSGLEAAGFLFLGFVPRSGRERTRWFEQVATAAVPVVFFESPHRIAKTISDIHELVKRPIQVHRELSKIHEEYVITPNTSSNDHLKPIGEFVVVVEPGIHGSIDGPPPTVDQDVASLLFDCLTNNGVLSETDAISFISKATSTDPRAVKKAVKKGRIARRRAADQLS